MNLHIEDSWLADLAASASSRSEFWQRLSDRISIGCMAEVGVWKGEFARHMLENCASIKRYYMIDPWARLPDWNKPFNVEQSRFDAIYEEAMRKTAFAADRRVVLREQTKRAVAAIPNGSLDFAYIDGDHTLRGITVDLISVMPKIREGGLIGGDDFTTRAWQHGLEFEPTLVFPFAVHFAEAMNCPIIGLPFNQFLIQKRSDATFSFIDTTNQYADTSVRLHVRRN